MFLLPLQVGYPDELAYKLYDRKAKCLIAFKQMKDAGQSYELALKYLDKATKLSADRKKQIERELRQALNFFKNAPAKLTKWVKTTVNINLQVQFAGRPRLF